MLYRNGLVIAVCALSLTAWGCSGRKYGGLGPNGGSGNDGPAQTADAGGPDAGGPDAGELPSDAGSAAPQRAELWYSVDDILVHITLNPNDGTVGDLVSHRLDVGGSSGLVRSGRTADVMPNRLRFDLKPIDRDPRSPRSGLSFPARAG